MNCVAGAGTLEPAMGNEPRAIRFCRFINSGLPTSVPTNRAFACQCAFSFGA
jgi:hypothetical protein